MNDKPKMYRGVIDKNLNNNRNIYASYSNKSDIRVYDSSEVRKKINNIFNSDTFIYRTKVNIIMSDRDIIKKVIGVYNNNLVTIDNEHIPISEIKDIYKI